MRIVIVHNAVAPHAMPDDMDVMVQVETIAPVLEEMGHEVFTIPCTLDLLHVKQQLEARRPDLVFNLVESLEGHGRLIHLFPALLDTMNLPYTGSPGMAIYVTSNKITAKNRMLALNIRTPLWIYPFVFENAEPTGSATPFDFEQDKWVIKSVWEHASIGLDEDRLIQNKTKEQLIHMLKTQSQQMGGEWFAEQYMEGREINISLLAGPDSPEMLPPAEIIFDGYPANKPKMVGYRAKWDTTSYEYHHTPRSFDFSITDDGLIQEIKTISLRCWRVFGLSGYARLDFRVDGDGRPWVLEINTNPCLSPDAGFSASMARAGLSYAETLNRIIEDARRKNIPSEPKRTKDHPPIHDKASKIKTGAPISFRYDPKPEDTNTVVRLAGETGFFREDEIRVAAELVEERLVRGQQSGYHFIFGLHGRSVVGYACFGPIACTVSSFDLYWIMVSPKFQNIGIGQALMHETERLIRKAGGTRIYIETSHKDQYKGSRSFYERCGYQLESVLMDFYAPGDSKAIYCKNYGLPSQKGPNAYDHSGIC